LSQELAGQEAEWAAAAEAAVAAARVAEAAEQQLDENQERIEAYLQGVSEVSNPLLTLRTSPNPHLILTSSSPHPHLILILT